MTRSSGGVELTDELIQRLAREAEAGYDAGWLRPRLEVMRTSLPCRVHEVHRPRCHVNEVHHVWPLGHGGPDVPENRVVICATGHNNVHRLLAEWLRAAGDPGWQVRRRFSPGERELAWLGYERIQRRAL